MIKTRYILMPCLLLSCMWRPELECASADVRKKEIEQASKRKVLQSVVLPRPTSIFNILEEENFDFNKYNSFPDKWNFKDDERTALNLGARVVDGILLLRATPSKKRDAGLKTLISTVIELVKSLGLEKELAEDITKFQEAASDAKKLNDISSDIDRISERVANVLRLNDDPDLAMLIGIGGWIETLYLSSHWLNDHYNDIVASEVVPRMEILDSFIDYFNISTKKIISSDVLKKIMTIMEGQVRPVFVILSGDHEKKIKKKAVEDLLKASLDMKRTME